MIRLCVPHIGAEEMAAAGEVLASGQLSQGPRVQAFEEAFARWCGVPHAIAVASGTAALHIAMLAHEIGPGDEVITPGFSFVASANCCLYVGARPVFADIDPETFTLDPQDVVHRLTPRTRAMVVVHLFGQPCQMDALAAIARDHGLVLIEDACQAHGARDQGRLVGSWGTACYSFYATKNMTTMEGGMITTGSDEIAARARMLRDHGSRQRYQHELLGFNLRMTDLQAAIGLVQLRKVDGWNERRRQNAGRLSEGLADIAGIAPPTVRCGVEHVFHQYTIRPVDREGLRERLRAAGVASDVYYPRPIPDQPLYRRLGYEVELPETERACREVLSLPVHPGLEASDVEQVIAAVRQP